MYNAVIGDTNSRSILVHIVKCNLQCMIWCNFSESSGIDGPFTADWLTKSDGLAGCSESRKESLLRVDISFEVWLCTVLQHWRVHTACVPKSLCICCLSVFFCVAVVEMFNI